MTANEVFDEITAQPKWYAGFCSAQNATNIKARFKAKELEFSTLQKMFNHYGFTLTASWNRVDNLKSPIGIKSDAPDKASIVIHVENKTILPPIDFKD